MVCVVGSGDDCTGIGVVSEGMTGAVITGSGTAVGAGSGVFSMGRGSGLRTERWGSISSGRAGVTGVGDGMS